MADTKIQWTDKTWNPVVGCTRVSAGCERCYAERQARRLAFLREEFYEVYGPLISNLWAQDSSRWRWSGKMQLFPERLNQPLHWRKPRRIFVNSMSDLFHEAVPFDFILKVFFTMRHASQHQFQILTKRPERMPKFFGYYPHVLDYPLPNVHLYASCEDQPSLDKRAPHLLATPAAVHGLSLEPLLGPIKIPHSWLEGACAHCHYTGHLGPNEGMPDPPGVEQCSCCVTHCRDESFARIDHVIVGGESGPGARPCHVEWIRSIKQQCQEADVPVFVKQLGAHVACNTHECTQPAACIGEYEGHGGEAPACDSCCGHGNEDGYCRPLRHSKGGDPSEWPLDLRVRQLPGEAGEES